MNEETRQQLLEGKEIYLDENGDSRWSASNKQGKRAGTWAARPGGAAEIINVERSVVLNTVRQEERLIAFENAIIRAAEEFTSHRINSLPEAEAVLVESQALKGMRGNTAASNLTLTLSGAMKPESGGITHVHQPTIQIANIGYTQEYVDRIIDTAPNYARHILDTANWGGAEELKRYTQQRLEEADDEASFDENG